MSDEGITVQPMALAHPDSARPTIPDDYGLPGTTDGLLGWDQVEERLRTSMHYWRLSVVPGGR
jgi:hypothetical protein